MCIRIVKCEEQSQWNRNGEMNVYKDGGYW